MGGGEWGWFATYKYAMLRRGSRKLLRSNVVFAHLGNQNEHETGKHPGPGE